MFTGGVWGAALHDLAQSEDDGRGGEGLGSVASIALSGCAANCRCGPCPRKRLLRLGRFLGIDRFRGHGPFLQGHGPSYLSVPVNVSTTRAATSATPVGRGASGAGRVHRLSSAAAKRPPARSASATGAHRPWRPSHAAR